MRCGGSPGPPSQNTGDPRLLQGRAVPRRGRCCPLAPAAPELLLGLRLCRVCWMRPSAQGWCHPHGASPGWNGAGVSSPRCGHGGDGEAAVWVVSQQQKALGFAFVHITYASGHCIS